MLYINWMCKARKSEERWRRQKWEHEQLFQTEEPEQNQPAEAASSLTACWNTNFIKHTHSTANTGGGARHNSCPIWEEPQWRSSACGGDSTCLCSLPPPPSSPTATRHDWEMKARGEEGEGMRASSRESSIHPIQLPHLHTVWLAASNLGAFPFEGRCM